MQEQEIDQLMQRLQDAFAAGEGSFLLSLRTQNSWDTAAFVQLIKDMRGACELYAGADMLDRWLADGFWYLPSFVQSWTSHPDFPRKQMPMDLRLANGLLEDLAHWFFTDDCPWEDPDSWLQSLLPKPGAEPPASEPQPASDQPEPVEPADPVDSAEPVA